MGTSDVKPRNNSRRPLDSVTAKDIAVLTGVSTTTVASILSGRNVVRVAEATRQLVLTTAQEKGYRRNQLATALRTGRTNTIGIISPLMWNGAEQIRYVYLTTLLTAINVAGARAGMNAMTFVDSPFNRLDIGAVTDGRIEGVILFGLPTDIEGSAEWIRELQKTGLPLVEIGSHYSRYQVQADNFGGMKLAARHLIDLGHTHIAYLQSPVKNPSSKARTEGFLAEVREAGLNPAQTPIVANEHEFRALLQSPERPTAVVCPSDRMAAFAYNCLRETGISIPEEMSVVGFDNSIVSEVIWPPLTAVDNPLTAMAESAVALLLDQINGQEISCEQPIIATHLEVRASTAPPRTAL